MSGRNISSFRSGWESGFSRIGKNRRACAGLVGGVEVAHTGQRSVDTTERDAAALQASFGKGEDLGRSVSFRASFGGFQALQDSPRL